MMMTTSNRIKIILYLLVVIFFCITFFLFKGTLALFEDNANGTADFNIGSWIIKINNNIITNGTVQNLVIDNFIYDTNATVTSAKIAPGMSAYSDLIFDASECDVAVKYDIEFKFDEVPYLDNINFSVEEIGGNSVVRTGKYTYSGIVDLASILNHRTTTLRVSVDWHDFNTDVYNANDTLLGTIEGNTLAIPFEVHAIQYLGETLTPYNETVENNGTVEGNGTSGD